MNELIKIQTELKAPKGKYNSFGKYKYRSCEDILEAVKPVLKKHEAVLTISDEMVQVGDRVYVKATAKLKVGDDEYTVTAYAREPETKKGMDEAQITGTASSYARKYALNGLFLIDDTKDPDTDEYTAQVRQGTVSAEKIGKIKAKALEELCSAKGVTVDKLYERYNVTKLEDLTEEQHTKAIKALNMTGGKNE